MTAPVLEKPDLCQQDRVASTMSQRQRYDFRQKAGSLGNDPTLRQEVKSLAEQIAAAIERTTSNVAKALQPAQHGQYDTELRTGSARISQQRSDAIAQSAKIVLWVDDRPENNLYERQAFHDYGVDFELATSTEDALFWLQRKKFDAIISDMGRPPDLRAGYTLLSAVRMRDDKTPFFIYAGSRSPQHLAEARSMGAQGTTNRPEELIAMVLQALGIGQSR